MPVVNCDNQTYTDDNRRKMKVNLKVSCLTTVWRVYELLAKKFGNKKSY